MKINISNCSKELKSKLFREEYTGNEAEFEADGKNVSFSPDRRFAVINIHNGLYIAVGVTDADDLSLSAEYVDSYLYDGSDEPMLQKLWIEWDCICYGFCKLRLWAPERVDATGRSIFTLHRFYFDRELYERKYEEINGVPYRKNDRAGE